MPFSVYVIAWLLVGFLAGSIPFGWLAARLRGINLREIGSGNIGATNVMRALGWGWGLAVLLLDVLKGLAPLIGLRVCLAATAPGYAPPESVPWLLMGTGVAAILGHTFTPWLAFKGGKGVATGLGVLVALMQWWVLAPLAAFVLITATTRIVSLGSVFAALLVGATILTVPELWQYWLIGVICPLLVLWTHRGNIARLLAGTEPRLGAVEWRGRN